MTNFGAFVELEEGIDGLIHISDLSWTKKVRHPGEVVKKGDSIEVVVLNVDRENRRISLGYKQTTENPWDTFEEIFLPGKITRGNIVRLIEKGVIVELPEMVDGFVPISHLQKPNISKPADGYKVGDELELCVIEFNKDAKKIVLSEKIDYALSLIRQREQGKQVEIEEPDDLFTEQIEKEKIDTKALEATVKEDKAEAKEDEKPTDEVSDEVESKATVDADSEAEAAEKTEAELTIGEEKSETEITETKADVEKIQAESTLTQAEPELATKKPEFEVTAEMEKSGEKTGEAETKPVTKEVKDDSIIEEKESSDEEKSEPVEEVSVSEEKTKEAPVAEKSSNNTKKKTTKKRSRKKKEPEEASDAE